MGSGWIFRARVWLIRLIAHGDVVAMNFVSDESAAVRRRTLPPGSVTRLPPEHPFYDRPWPSGWWLIPSVLVGLGLWTLFLWAIFLWAIFRPT